MTLKIGDSQSLAFSVAENTPKSEREKLQSNSLAENEAAINYLANSNPAVRANNTITGGDDQKTVGDFLRKVTAEQPFDEKASARKPIRIIIDAKKPTAQATVADYDKATWRAIFRQAGYGMLTDQEIALAVGAMNAVGWKVVDTNFNLANLRAEDAKPGAMVITTQQDLIEKAKRAGQAVLQYQEYQSNLRDAAIEKGKTYVNEAMGGFVQAPINGAVNIVNGISEPLRAGERLAFGTNYIPEVPKMTVAEKSEYWNKDGRMYANKGGEIIATVAFGGILGGKALTTQTGRILLGAESGYNIGAGLAGKDITQSDAQGNPRQMEWLERGTRIAGGLFGARQTIKTEISTPNSITNKATDTLDDIFKNPPPIKPQGEFVTPEGFRVRVDTFEKPLQTSDDLNLEIRGRGGYESNEIYDNVGTKMPKANQPFEVSPSLKPGELSKPLGEAESIPAKASLENVRGLKRQNEAAETLAKNGYRVEQKPQMTYLDKISNPWRNTNKKPDFKIEGEIFDAYAPNKYKTAKGVRSEIEDKISERQTRRIVLNLDDCPIRMSDLKKSFWEKPIAELEQILIVKDGKVEKFFPFGN